MKPRAITACLLVGLAGFGISAALSLASWPEPQFHDEFSYLLAADTFARGCIANPPHPLWVHFETFHVNQQPTYCSIYPPAQGMALALGQIIFHPLVGVWLSVAWACAAICWMLRAFVPPRAALLGGVLALLMMVFSCTPEAAGYWSQSYWGGAVAAAGGALVFGALGRLCRKITLPSSLTLGLGLAVLANSRPYEGLIVSILAALGLLALMLRSNGPPAAVALKLIIVPLVLIGLVTLGGMAYCNWRTTGDPSCTPYQLNNKTYTLMPHSPHFFWQPLAPKEPAYNHREMWQYYVLWTRMMVQESVSNFGNLLLLKLRVLWQFYVGWVLSIPLVIALPYLLRNRWTRFALATCGLLLAGLLALNFVFPHYAAPATGLIVLLEVQSLRCTRVMVRRLRPIKRLPALLVVAFACLQVGTYWHTTSTLTETWHRDRARLLRECRREGGKHLMAVTYVDGHNIHREWVYNEADIDAAPVVWARLMPDADKNARLFEYFKERRIWLLEIGERVRVVGVR